MANAHDAGLSEELQLKELEESSLPVRAIGYFKLMGPGYLQSAMTLGGGTAFAAIFAGAAFGYQLLWVAPLGMLLGIIVLSAVAHQTLSTGANPFQAMKEHAGAFFAYAWAIAAILSSIIWQFAQYALASAMLVLLVRQAGYEGESDNLLRAGMGGLALIWCIGVALLYGRTPRLVKLYENVLKVMVWFIIACFAIVVIRTGIPAPGELLRGFVPSIPADVPTADGDDIVAIVQIVSILAAAVGVNMLFVYPYSLRRRQWGRGHRRLAKYDLIFGMFVPFAIAASLILIAAASILHFGEPDLFTGKKMSPDAVAQILAAPDRLGPVIGVWVFGLGIIAMALSSITMQMLCSGFAFSEMFGWSADDPKTTAATMLPAIGVLGSVFWSDIVMWVAVPTNVICGALMPLAYVAFIILQRNRRYLGDDLPRGTKGNLWQLGMIVATLVLVVFLAIAIVQEVPGFVERIGDLFKSGGA